MSLAILDQYNVLMVFATHEVLASVISISQYFNIATVTIKSISGSLGKRLTELRDYKYLLCALTFLILIHFKTTTVLLCEVCYFKTNIIRGESG